jgi:hypothetical protein
MGRLKKMAVLGAPLALGAGAVYAARELAQTDHVPFPRLREFMNRTVDPMVLRAGLVGGHTSELGCLEHVGRVSGEIHHTPVYPRLIDDRVVIPLPLRERSEWARNVLAAGRCRLQLHEKIHELDQPEIVKLADLSLGPDWLRGVEERLDLEAMRLHRVSEAEATFATLEPTMAPMTETIKAATPEPEAAKADEVGEPVMT